MCFLITFVCSAISYSSWERLNSCSSAEPSNPGAISTSCTDDSSFNLFALEGLLGCFLPSCFSFAAWCGLSLSAPLCGSRPSSIEEILGLSCFLSSASFFDSFLYSLTSSFGLSFCWRGFYLPLSALSFLPGLVWFSSILFYSFGASRSSIGPYVFMYSGSISSSLLTSFIFCWTGSILSTFSGPTESVSLSFPRI